ncbi:MAG: hypothetical protein KF781_07555 [Chitinophagaceae bacterium]|nr:hypothetical protein [Chitinophagaceae bacterium]MCW5905610.1 hypothetical protein [Chitinophagaceae bacterium]
MKTKLYKLIGTLLLALVLSLPAIAQDEFDPPLDDIPVDGGLTLLLAAGVGYGAKKLRDNKKKQQQIK